MTSPSPAAIVAAARALNAETLPYLPSEDNPDFRFFGEAARVALRAAYPIIRAEVFAGMGEPLDEAEVRAEEREKAIGQVVARLRAESRYRHDVEDVASAVWAAGFIEREFGGDE